MGRDDQPDRERDVSRDTLHDGDEETKVGDLASSKLLQAEIQRLQAEIEPLDSETMVVAQSVDAPAARLARTDLRVPPPVPYASSVETTPPPVAASRPPSDPPTLEIPTDHLPPLAPDPLASLAESMTSQIDEHLARPTRRPPAPSLSVATPLALPPVLPSFLPQFLEPRAAVTSERVDATVEPPTRRRRVRRSVILPWPAGVMLVAIVVAKVVEHVRRGDLIETIVLLLRAVGEFFKHMLA